MHMQFSRARFMVQLSLGPALVPVCALKGKGSEEGQIRAMVPVMYVDGEGEGGETTASCSGGGGRGGGKGGGKTCKKGRSGGGLWCLILPYPGPLSLCPRIKDLQANDMWLRPLLGKLSHSAAECAEREKHAKAHP